MKYMNVVKRHASKIAVVAGSSLMVGSANAALSAEAEAAATAMTTAATDYIAMAWTIVPIVVVGFVGIKLFKKAASKAT
ncbi:major coat protein [Vibrio cyclitrophicus]